MNVVSNNKLEEIFQNDNERLSSQRNKYLQAISGDDLLKNSSLRWIKFKSEKLHKLIFNII